MRSNPSMAWLRTPVGPIYLAAAVLSLGRGAWFTCAAIFFTRSLGLSTTQFGVGITAAALVGLVIGSPLGYLADRVGPREVLISLAAVQGVAVLCYSFARGFWSVCIIACIAVSAERAAPGIRTAVVVGLTAAEERLPAIAMVRVVTQTGVVLGALVGSLILYLDSRPAYLALVVGYGLLNIAFAVLTVRVPHVVSLSERRISRRVLVLRDRPFLLVTLLNSLLMLNWGLLGSGVPLWISVHTGAPVWIVGVLLALNSSATVVFQRRAARRADTVSGAARLSVWAGLALSCSCAVFATTYHTSGAFAVTGLLLAASIHAVGEMWAVASGWALSVGLTLQEAHGEYQGMFSTGTAMANMAAPAVMTVLLVQWGMAGWVTLGVVFLAGGIPTPAATRWAMRGDRERDVVLS